MKRNITLSLSPDKPNPVIIALEGMTENKCLPKIGLGQAIILNGDRNFQHLSKARDGSIEVKIHFRQEMLSDQWIIFSVALQMIPENSFYVTEQEFRGKILSKMFYEFGGYELSCESIS